MKKHLGLIFVLLLAGFIAAGCGAPAPSYGGGSSAGHDDDYDGTLAIGNDGAPAASSDDTQAASYNGSPAARQDVHVDVDLTALSSTMAQAEFINILTNPSDYLGKTIRVRGPYFNINFQEFGEVFHFVMVIEGDECCRMGFEFILSGDYAYPDDFPSQYARIEITGVLSVIEHGEQNFLYLATDEITLL